MATTTTAVSTGDFTFDVSVAGPQDGVPVILLHGFPQTSACWDSVVPHLTDAGLRTFAPNQRGYSPGARPDDTSSYALPELVGDVFGLVHAMDLGPVHLVGHDWGAIVAWQAAADRPEYVRTLTAVSVPHPAAFGWAMREDAQQRERSKYMTLLRQEGKAEHVLLENGARRLHAMLGGGDAAQQYVDHLREPGALTAALEWYRAMGPGFGDTTQPVRIPTTYVWSNADTAVGNVAAERCGDFVGDDYSFVVLDGISHWVPEQAPDRLASEIVARVRSAD